MLIPRRLPNVYNAAYRSPTNMTKRSYNPAFMHPNDLARLGLRSGDLVTIRSRNGEITGIVEEDADLRTGLVSITHGFGRNPGDASDPRRDGANVNLLTRMDDDYERYTGLPRMGALPIAVTPSNR
jgi:anaerobic selenocysteine-containing dehydrogenase